MLIFLVFACYACSFESPFLWTDQSELSKNVWIRSWNGVVHAWLHPGILPSFPSFGPMSYTALSPQFRLWADRFIPGYHGVSILLHAGIVLSIWVVLRRLNVSGAWLAAAVFAVHPVHVQSVSWISQQGNLWSTLMLLGSLLFYLRFARIMPPPPADLIVDGTKLSTFVNETGTAADEWLDEPQTAFHRWTNYGLSLALFLLGVLAKPGTFLFPAVLLTLLWWRRGRITKGDLIALLPFALAAIAATGVAWIKAPPVTDTVLTQVLSAGRSFWFCAGKLLWPFGLLLAYPPDPSAAWVGWIAVAMIGVVAAALWGSSRWIGGAPFIAALLFVTTFVPPLFFGTMHSSGWEYALDRQQYLPSIVAIAFVSAALTQGADRFAKGRLDLARALRLAPGVLLLPMLATFTVLRVLAYTNERALWDDVLVVDEGWPTAHFRLAQMYLATGDQGEAASHLLLLLRLNPNDEAAMVELAVVYEAQLRWNDAADMYEKVLARRYPADDAELRTRLGLTWVARSRPDEAMREFRRALVLRPDDAWIATQLGMQYANSNDLDHAAELFERALRNNPQLSLAMVQLADVRFRQARYPEAANLLHEVVKIDPSNYDAYMASGTMLARLKEYSRAEPMFRAAVRIKGESAAAWHNLGMVLVMRGSFGEAIYVLDKASQLDPANAEIRQHLAAARAMQREKQKDPLAIPQ